MTPCDHIHCQQPARYAVSLELRTTANQKPARTGTVIRVCQQHRDALTFDNLMTAEAWAVICAGFAGMGRALPVRECSNLVFGELGKVN